VIQTDFTLGRFPHDTFRDAKPETMNEADTCRRLVVPKLQASGWDDTPHEINEQRSFTDGRIVFVGGKARRGKQKRADYIL